MAFEQGLWHLEGDLEPHIRPQGRLEQDAAPLVDRPDRHHLDRCGFRQVYADRDRYRQRSGLFLDQETVDGLVAVWLVDEYA